MVLLAADPARTGGGRRATSSFGRRVEAVRSQLAPIDRVAVLARAFGQEAFQWLPDHPTTGARGGSADAVRIAYAIRWIELRSDLAMPPWPWHPDRAPGAR